MTTVLFVTWDGGGNVPPALGIADRLRHAGVTVRFLGHEQQRAGIESAGFAFVPYRRARRWSSVDQAPGWRGSLGYIALFTDRGPGLDLQDEVKRERPDLVVIDCFLYGALDAAQRAGIPYVVLVHTFLEFLVKGSARGPIGLVATLRRMRPHRLWDKARLVLVVAQEELDPAAHRRHPENLRYSGPAWTATSVIESSGSGPAGSEPRILVSLSSIHWDGQLAALQSILDGIATMPLQAILTTGPAVEAARLRVPHNVEVHRFLPHSEVMPTVSLVVGHGGHSTTMLALAHGLPLVMMPMFQLVDQPMVATAVARAGAGVVLRRTASPEVVREAVARVLRNEGYRRAAGRLGSAIRQRDGAQVAAELIVECTRTERAAAPAP